MGDLERRPDHFLLFPSFMRSILGVLEFVGEFKQRVFDVFKSIGWGLAVSGATDRRHFESWVAASGDDKEEWAIKSTVNVTTTATRKEAMRQ